MSIVMRITFQSHAGHVQARSPTPRVEAGKKSLDLSPFVLASLTNECYLKNQPFARTDATGKNHLSALTPLRVTQIVMEKRPLIVVIYTYCALYAHPVVSKFRFTICVSYPGGENEFWRAIRSCASGSSYPNSFHQCH